MTAGLVPFILATWVLSFTGYALAGLLMWRRRIHRTVHILMTVAAFLADVVALAMQNIHMMQEGIGMAEIPIALRTADGVTTDLSIGLYCLVALLGFSRIVGWHRLGRWHVPSALLFLAVWLAARAFGWAVMAR